MFLIKFASTVVLTVTKKNFSRPKFFSKDGEVYTAEFLAKIPSVDFCLADANKSEISIYLFKSCSQTTAITVNYDYVLPEEDRRLPMKVLIHGYTSNVTTPWFKEMKKAYFHKGPHNIIYIDWSVPANKSYAISAANIKPVGEYLAEFIINLKTCLEGLHLIGHSLGAHLAGFVGKNVYTRTGEKIGRITATDAAGPGFEHVGPESRLSKYDATLVDVYHTDAGYYGITKPIGHVDFYVNGGKFQLGCPTRTIDDNCSHARSNDYFIESIITDNFTALSAKFDDTGEVIPGNKQDRVVFGDAVPTTARGIYYIKTQPTSPFLLLKQTKKT